MKKKLIISYVFAIIIFTILTGSYEYYVYIWSLGESTPVIRVDIFLIYPIILTVSTFVFLGVRKLLRKKH